MSCTNAKVPAPRKSRAGSQSWKPISFHLLSDNLNGALSKTTCPWASHNRCNNSMCSAHCASKLQLHLSFSRLTTCYYLYVLDGKKWRLMQRGKLSINLTNIFSNCYFTLLRDEWLERARVRLLRWPDLIRWLLVLVGSFRAWGNNGLVTLVVSGSQFSSSTRPLSRSHLLYNWPDMICFIHYTCYGNKTTVIF